MYNCTYIVLVLNTHKLRITRLWFEYSCIYFEFYSTALGFTPPPPSSFPFLLPEIISSIRSNKIAVCGYKIRIINIQI